MGLLVRTLSALLDGWRRQRMMEASSSSSLFAGEGRILLHVGCGPARKEHTTPAFQAAEWREVRLDIDPAVGPDVVASMLDMYAVPDATVDAVYSSHNIEHLYPHEVPVALAEFFRVLNPDGLLVLTCPDLQSICWRVAEGAADQPAYISPAGPIAPLDMLYGHRPHLAAGNLFMAHRFGFTLDTLAAHLRAAGFSSVVGKRYDATFDLWCVASRQQLTETELQGLAAEHLPPD